MTNAHPSGCEQPPCCPLWHYEEKDTELYNIAAAIAAEECHILVTHCTAEALTEWR